MENSGKALLFQQAGHKNFDHKIKAKEPKKEKKSITNETTNDVDVAVERPFVK